MTLEDIYNDKLKKRLINQMQLNAPEPNPIFGDMYDYDDYDELAQNFIDKQYDPELIPQEHPIEYLDEAMSENPFNEMFLGDGNNLTLKYDSPAYASAEVFDPEYAENYLDLNSLHIPTPDELYDMETSPEDVERHLLELLKRGGKI